MRMGFVAGPSRTLDGGVGEQVAAGIIRQKARELWFAGFRLYVAPPARRIDPACSSYDAISATASPITVFPHGIARPKE
jgi:hypothetical protein